jgi:hypothetical protein
MDWISSSLLLIGTIWLSNRNTYMVMGYLACEVYVT